MSCFELIKAKLSNSFIQKNLIRGVNFLKVWKIFNKQQKIIFDNLNDYLIDFYNKFGEEKKTHEFLFLTIEYKEKNDLIKFLLNGWNQSDERENLKFFLSDSLNEQILLKSKNGNNVSYFTIICKCFIMEEMVASQSQNFDEDLNNNLKFFFQNFISENSSSTLGKSIIEIRDINTQQKYYSYLNTALILPEFFVEFDFTYSQVNSDCNRNIQSGKINLNSYLVSSFFNKSEFDENFKRSLNTFNDCCKFMTKYENEFNTEKILDHVDENFFGKFSSCKYKEFEEINNSPLYFVKSSVLKYMSDCFRFNSVKDFEVEMNKISERFEEINNLKFQFNSSDLIYKFDVNKIKVFNLFNSNLNESFWEEIKEFPKMLELEEFRLSSNNLKTLDTKFFLNFPNLKILDLSLNSIDNLKFHEVNTENIFEKLTHLDLSFNYISKFSDIIEFIENYFLFKSKDSAIKHRLEFLTFIGNPIEKKFLFISENDNERLSHQCFNFFFNLTNLDHLNFIKILTKQINTNKICINEITNSSKNFSILYHTYSFSDKLLPIISDNKLLNEPTKNTEEDYNALFLSKRKLKEIPKFDNEIKDNNHKDLQNFNILYLNFNKISQIENLENFSTIRELYLQNNKIKNIENLKNLSNLLKLDLSNNQINKIEGLDSLKSLQWLNLENNIIESLNIKQLTHIKNLSEFNIASNFLTNFKELIQLRALPCLIILDITGNEVCKSIPDFRIQTIFYLNKLKVLNKMLIDKPEIQNARDYFDGKITSDLLEVKTGCENVSGLIELNLSNCKIKDVSYSNENFFNTETAPNMKKLDLSRNLLTSFKIFGNLPTLIELNLNSNLFEKILNRKEKQINQKGILGITNLENLEMSSNNLSELFGIQVLKNLKNLNLSRNNLNKIDFIDGLVQLNFLDISFNKLRNVEKSNIGFLPNLRIFLCDSNYLKTVNSFSKLTSLLILSFDSNKIQSFQSVEMLSELENLKEINLNNNPINNSYNYRTNMIRKFPNLNKIDTSEVTKEEKEMTLMDVQYLNDEENNFNLYINYNSSNYNMHLLFDKNLCQPSMMNLSNTKNFVTKNTNTVKINNNANIPPIQKIDKPPIKIKYVHLDLMFGSNHYIIPNNSISNSNKYSFDENYLINMNSNNISNPNILNKNYNQISVQKRLISPKRKIINGSEFNLPQISQNIREGDNSTSVKSNKNSNNKKQQFKSSMINTNSTQNNGINNPKINTKNLIDLMKREVLSNNIGNSIVEQSVMNRAQEYYTKILEPRPKSNFNSKNKNK